MSSEEWEEEVVPSRVGYLTFKSCGGDLSGVSVKGRLKKSYKYWEEVLEAPPLSKDTFCLSSR